MLTAELCKTAGKVVAVELDKKLIPILAETLSECENVKIINDDALKIDLNKLIEDEFMGMDVVVCGKSAVLYNFSVNAPFVFTPCG